MKKLWDKFWGIEGIRYIFWGGCTTLFSYVIYIPLVMVFFKPGADYTGATKPVFPAGLFPQFVTTTFGNLVSNTISVVLALLFAYFVNSRFVFKNSGSTFKQRLPEFWKFVASRVFTMVLEIAGGWALGLIPLLGVTVGKLSAQIFCVILNYFFGKFMVFNKNKDAEEKSDKLDFKV